MFEIGDKIEITGICNDYIGGIHNYMTTNYIKTIFGKKVVYDKTFLKNIKGEVILKGKFNMYVIESDGHFYIFCNDYEEMILKDEKGKKYGK